MNTVSDEGVDEDYNFSKAVQRTKNNKTGPQAFFLATKRTGLEQTPSKSKRFKFNCLPEDWGTRRLDLSLNPSLTITNHPPLEWNIAKDLMKHGGLSQRKQ